MTLKVTCDKSVNEENLKLVGIFLRSKLQKNSYLNILRKKNGRKNNKRNWDSNQNAF